MTDNRATGTGGAIWFDGVTAKFVLHIDRPTLTARFPTAKR